MVALYHGSFLSLLILITLFAQPFLEHCSQVSLNRWDWPDFAPQSPSATPDWQTQNAALFQGGKKRSMKPAKGGKGEKGLLPKNKRGEHVMLDDSSQRGDSHHFQLSPPPHPSLWLCLSIASYCGLFTRWAWPSDLKASFQWYSSNPNQILV